MIVVFKTQCPLTAPPHSGEVQPLGRVKSSAGSPPVRWQDILESVRVDSSSLHLPRIHWRTGESADYLAVNVQNPEASIRILREIREKLLLQFYRPMEGHPEEWGLFGDNFCVQGAKVLHFPRTAGSIATLGFGLVGGAMIYCWFSGHSPRRVYPARAHQRPMQKADPAALRLAFLNLLEKKAIPIMFVLADLSGEPLLVSAKELAEKENLAEGRQLSSGASMWGMLSYAVPEDDSIAVLEAYRRTSHMNAGLPLAGVRWEEGTLWETEVIEPAGYEGFGPIWRFLQTGRDEPIRFLLDIFKG